MSLVPCIIPHKAWLQIKSSKLCSSLYNIHLLKERANPINRLNLCYKVHTCLVVWAKSGNKEFYSNETPFDLKYETGFKYYNSAMGGAYTGSHKQKMFEKYINI